MMTIGSLTLRDFEVPQRIKYGGQQRLAIHHLGDGRRIVETLGHDDADIEFGGTLTGADAANRARMLENMCRSASQVPLVWDANRMTVIVQRFAADYATDTWIDYRLTCSVVDTATAPIAPDETISRSEFAADAAAIMLLDASLAAGISAITSVAAAADAFVPGAAANEQLRGLVADAISSRSADPGHPADALVTGYLRRMLTIVGAGTSS